LCASYIWYILRFFINDGLDLIAYGQLQFTPTYRIEITSKYGRFSDSKILAVYPYKKLRIYFPDLENYIAYDLFKHNRGEGANKTKS